jgi:four helix bundle protein
MAAHSDLKVWQLSMDLVETIYVLTARFPREEMYGLTQQMRRAAVSIPSNIAEGYGREQPGYIVQFLRVAMGSARELETQIKLANRLAFATPGEAERARDQCEQVGKMLRSLIRSVEVRSGST